MKKIGILNGPNLNRLGKREPDVYGSRTLDDILGEVAERAEALGIEVDAFQSNHEGELIDRIHSWADEGIDGLIANPGAYTHTSVALRDAIASTSLRCVEVHLSNIHRREPFRHHSYISPLAEAVICGLGPFGYRVALDYFAKD